MRQIARESTVRYSCETMPERGAMANRSGPPRGRGAYTKNGEVNVSVAAREGITVQPDTRPRSADRRHPDMPGYQQSAVGRALEKIGRAVSLRQRGPRAKRHQRSMAIRVGRGSPAAGDRRGPPGGKGRAPCVTERGDKRSAMSRPSGVAVDRNWRTGVPESRPRRGEQHRGSRLSFPPRNCRHAVVFPYNPPVSR